MAETPGRKGRAAAADADNRRSVDVRLGRFTPKQRRRLDRMARDRGAADIADWALREVRKMAARHGCTRRHVPGDECGRCGYPDLPSLPAPETP